MRFFVHIYRGQLSKRQNRNQKTNIDKNETAENFQINYQP